MSVDSQFTHNAWRNTPVTQGGIGPVGYTMVADLSHAICKAYDVETPDGTVAFRGIMSFMPNIDAALFFAKMGFKLAGLMPTVRGFGHQGHDGIYYSLMMSTGLTFGTISALFGLNHGIIDQFNRAVKGFVVNKLRDRRVAIDDCLCFVLPARFDLVSNKFAAAITVCKALGFKTVP